MVRSTCVGNVRMVGVCGAGMGSLMDFPLRLFASRGAKER